MLYFFFFGEYSYEVVTTSKVLCRHHDIVNRYGLCSDCRNATISSFMTYDGS